MGLPGGPVARVLASPRRRRRLALGTGLALVGGSLAFVGLRYPNTGHKLPTHITSEPPQLVDRQPPAAKLSSADREAARVVAARFIDTAVLRQRVGDSFDLTTPAMRQGMTRAQWSTGNIPVVPYPAAAVRVIRYRLDYSEAHKLWLKIAIVPKRSSSADAQTFSIGLEKGVGGRPWRVDYWSPAGVGVRNPGKPPAIVSETKASLAKGWIFLPIGLFLAALLSIPVGLAVRGWIRTSRANRSYRLTL